VVVVLEDVARGVADVGLVTGLAANVVDDDDGFGFGVGDANELLELGGASPYGKPFDGDLTVGDDAIDAYDGGAEIVPDFVPIGTGGVCGF